MHPSFQSVSTAIPVNSRAQTGRLKIAFFDYPDVFEDFYPHYGVDHHAFGTTWQNTANHAWLKLVQQHVGDVAWHVTSLRNPQATTLHETVGCQIQWVPSSWMHRQLWHLFYQPKQAWRWQSFYRTYALCASYLAPLSWPLWRTLQQNPPDALFVQDYCSGRYDVLLLFSRLLNIPLITLHSGSIASRYLGKALKRFSIPRADAIFPSGQAEAHRLRHEYAIPESRLFILRPPVDTEVYRPMERDNCCREFGLAPGKRYLLFVGRLDDGVKRISTILEQFALRAARYPDVDFVIAGSGRDEAALRTQASQNLPGRVHFVGWLPNDQRKVMIFNLAECLVLASWREASPAVIGEAFACGTPVVSSDVGGISDLVQEGISGWLFPAGDDTGLGRCLEEVMAQPGKSAGMRREARRRALDLVSLDVTRATLQAGFASVLKSRP
jgi:glycosyltransferase involved in cell wall biosynthesis